MYDSRYQPFPIKNCHKLKKRVFSGYPHNWCRDAKDDKLNLPSASLEERVSWILEVTRTGHLQPRPSGSCSHCGSTLVSGLIFCLGCDAQIEYDWTEMYQDSEAVDAVDPASTLADMAKLLDLETVLDLKPSQSPALGDGESSGSGSGSGSSSSRRTPEQQAEKETQDRNRMVQYKGNVKVASNWKAVSKIVKQVLSHRRKWDEGAFVELAKEGKVRSVSMVVTDPWTPTAATDLPPDWRGWRATDWDGWKADGTGLNRALMADYCEDNGLTAGSGETWSDAHQAEIMRISREGHGVARHHLEDEKGATKRQLESIAELMPGIVGTDARITKKRARWANQTCESKVERAAESALRSKGKIMLPSKRSPLHSLFYL